MTRRVLVGELSKEAPRNLAQTETPWVFDWYDVGNARGQRGFPASTPLLEVLNELAKNGWELGATIGGTIFLQFRL